MLALSALNFGVSIPAVKRSAEEIYQRLKYAARRLPAATIHYYLFAIHLFMAQYPVISFDYNRFKARFAQPQIYPGVVLLAEG